MNTLTEVFEAQLATQQATIDADFEAAAERRDALIRGLTAWEVIQMKLAAGILQRIVD